MGKIGILTFHKSINYGSVLQAWALQDFLMGKGYDVEIIDYEPEMYHTLYDVFVKGLRWADIKENIKRIPIMGSIKKQSLFFASFRKRYLKMSMLEYKYDSDFTSLSKLYDCIICGSDQIWNVRACDCDAIFFLPNVCDLKKIAYSVSINDTNYSEERYKDTLKEWIESFEQISVREITGKEKLEAYLNNTKNISVALDPTLLHEKKDFRKIASKRIIKKPYIFMYYAWYNSQIADIGKVLSEKLNLPIYTCLMKKDSKKIYELYRNGIKSVLDKTSPEDFLSLIMNSEFVITDSFHGTAFSIISEKSFICVNYINENGVLKNDERIINIISQLGLNDRYISIKDIQTFDVTKKVNYRDITKKRMKMAEFSKKWLINAIGDSM